MYIPENNRITDEQVIHEFILANIFAIVITSDAEGVPFASHLPLMVEKTEAETFLLHGHCARANPHWKYFEQSRPTLVIFHGAHSYISPRWYNHENVPTWNYMTVHAYCKPRIFTDHTALRTNVSALTQHYENDTGYSVDGLSPKFLDTELRGIVGFTLEVERFEAKFKLSQNRDEESHASVVAHLKQAQTPDSTAIAEAMRKHHPFELSQRSSNP